MNSPLVSSLVTTVVGIRLPRRPKCSADGNTRWPTFVDRLLAGGATDHRHLHRTGAGLKLAEPTRGAQRRPQPGESRTEDHDVAPLASVSAGGLSRRNVLRRHGNFPPSTGMSTTVGI